MTKVFNLSEAKDQLSSLVDRAASGEEIVIAKPASRGQSWCQCLLWERNSRESPRIPWG